MTPAGRPAGPTTDTTTVVLTAALELLLTEGASALTAQRLHTVTGVSRSTIYRHWPTSYVVLEALIEVAPVAPATRTGDLAHDLHAEVDLLCDRLRDKPVAAFLQALAAAASADPATVHLRHRYVADLLEPFHAVLRDADLSQTEREDIATAIVAPLIVDSLLLDRPAARARAHRTVDRMLPKKDQP